MGKSVALIHAASFRKPTKTTSIEHRFESVSLLHGTEDAMSHKTEDEKKRQRTTHREVRLSWRTESGKGEVGKRKDATTTAGETRREAEASKRAEQKVGLVGAEQTEKQRGWQTLFALLAMG